MTRIGMIRIGMIRIDNPADIGRTMGHIRVMLRLSMRQLARQVAARTGRHENRVRHQLWAWETGHTVPSMPAAAPFLAELGIGLAFVPLDENGSKTALSASVAAQEPPASVSGRTEGAEAISGASEAWPNGVRCPVVNDWCPGGTSGALCIRPCNPEEA